MKLSDATAASLIEVVAGSYSHAELDTLFLRLGCSDVGPTVKRSSTAQGPNKMSRVRPIVDELRTRSDKPDVISLVRELIEEHLGGHILNDRGNVVPHLERLVHGLELDGYAIIDGVVVATTPDPVALGLQISQLEIELGARNLDVAMSHYRQAIDSFTDGRLEASNGQLRSFLEDFMLTTSEQILGARPNTVRSAADRLRNSGHLDADEASLIGNLASISNPRGAHAGLTDREEALFRLHMTTALARYLLARLP